MGDRSRERAGLLEALARALPVQIDRAALPAGNVGLIVVDAVQGFTRQGSMSDPISLGPMVAAIDALVRELDRRLGPRLHLLILRDRHHPEVPEPPYPPHCLAGTAESTLDPQLAWLAQHPRATVLDKDCINGFVGAMRPAAEAGSWRNGLVDWARERQLAALVLTGDCTDICVSDLTVALLSARNHGMLTSVPPGQRQAYAAAITALPILVHVPACATYDLDPDGPLAPETLRHPGALAQHVGLWTMASRGARLVDGFSW